ncbi:TK/FER protein kinase [Loa loa]|uniref:Tyrosine-protein kinase n=1 Tax=Loa loa TaxID=7209 RepID=A0A1S0U8W3_LOALO|nr:TK/FER protein kinase [Loa loa]EFO27094.1 TK/FER protein kinase [Loa loa]
MIYRESGLEFAEWYHGLLPRQDINILLSKNGQFLVRETEIKKGEGFQLVLSVKWNDKTMHFIIRQADEKFFIEKRQFASVCELIKYHLITKDPITDQSGAVLLDAVPRQSWEIRHEQIELNELLGEGAMSAVYRGIFKDDEKEKEVAVKVRKGRRSDRETVEQICREARIMRKLEHPNVVRLYGIAINKEPVMLLMELLKDGSLDVFLVTKGSTLSIREKLYFCLDIASGLEFLHNNGVIHRDISARNCLVEDMCVKISDFNLSREIRKQDDEYKMTRLKQNLPIRWLAPETIRNAIYTTKSDVFSYGILLWEVFTNGAEPYCGMTVAEVIVKVKDGYRIPSPDTMPERLQILQQNCFATEASKRWSMAQIRGEIEMIVYNFEIKLSST